jgi:hypothetical protein
MAYYPNYAPPAAPPNYSNHAPPYAAPYTPPMRNSPGNVREQQPGEEWVQGSDGSYYPPNQRNMAAPAPPARARHYWEN